MQTSIREWALRQGWGGRPVRQESAQGILVAALGVLAKHYGIRDLRAPICMSRIVTGDISERATPGIRHKGCTV